MKNFIENYKSTLILLIAIVIGGVVGIIFGEDARVLEPLGTLFLNLMFMIIVPLVFFSISSAIASMSSMKRLGSIISKTFIIFIVTAVISAVIALIGTIIFDASKGINIEAIKSLMEGEAVETTTEKVSPLLQFVNTVSAQDFNLLFSKSNMLQLIVFSIIIGISTASIGEKGSAFAKVLKSGNDVCMKFVSIIMMYAPIGLLCYFASVVGQLGSQILEGYVKVFALYLILTAICYFGLFSLYAFVSGGKLGAKVYWKNVLPATVTALATCSSAASIPVNMSCAKNMKVPNDIAETVIPLGANIHKDGSVIGGIIKITFIFGIMGRDFSEPKTIMGILIVGFLVGAVMGAIPSGGMIGEMLIISVYGFSPNILPIIAVISTIIDAPATVLNSTGNTVCAMMVSRFVEGKDWLLKTYKAKV